jgi:TP901 family phage tail tape measure protein
VSNFYGELLIRITSDTAGLSRGLQQSAAQTNAASKSMEAAGKKARVSWERVGLGMQNVGRTMSQFVTIPIAAGFAFAAYAGYKYSKTLLQIRNLTGLTAAETERYGQAILGMSKYGVGPQKLAESMYFISSSGFKAAEALKVLDVAAKASASGMGEVQPIADVLTSAMNAYGHSALSAKRATDILMKTIEVGKAEPEALATSLGRIMPVAAKLGVPLGQVGGAIAGLTLTGLSAAEAVTALRGTMVALSAPAKMSIEELKKLGLSYGDVTKSIKDKGLLATMEMLYQKTGGNMLAMRKLVPNVRALNGILSLLGPNYKKNVEITKEVIASNGKLAESFKATAETPVQKFRVAIASIQASFIKMGIQIMPTVAAIVSKIGELFEAFGNMSDSKKSILMWGAVVVAALGPIIMITGSVIRSVALIKGALSSLTLIQGIGSMFAVFKGGGGVIAGITAMTSALSPLTIALLGVAAAAASIYGFVKLTDWLDGTTARIAKMNRGLELIEVDPTGKLADKLDRAFGGHLVSKAGKITWQPQVGFKPPPQASGLVKWVKQEAQLAVNAIREKNKMIMIEEARANLAYWQQQKHEAEEAAQYARTTQAREAADARVAEFDARAREQGVLLAQLTGQMQGLQALGSKLNIFAGMKDQENAISKQIAKVKELKAELAKKPGDVELGLKVNKAERNLKKLQDDLNAYKSEHYEAILDVRDQNARKRLREVNRALADLHKMKASPKVDALIAAFERERKRVLRELDEIDRAEASPTVTANVGQALGALSSVQDMIAGIKSKTVTLNILKNYGYEEPQAQGGIHPLVTPTRFLAGESGPEVAAFFPLNDPSRSSALLAQLNAMLGGGKQAAGGGRATGEMMPSDINVNVVLPAGTMLQGNAQQLGNAIAPYVARALEREDARAGRRR